MIGQCIQCDSCGKLEYSIEEQNITKLRVTLTANKGWYFLKVDRHLKDFCSDECCQKWLFQHKMQTH